MDINESLKKVSECDCIISITKSRKPYNGPIQFYYNKLLFKSE